MLMRNPPSHNKSRRDFFKKLLASAVTYSTVEIDVDRLLWVPGERIIFLPSPHLTIDEMTATAYEMILPKLPILFDRDDFFYAQLVNPGWHKVEK